jgi:hypothetical protein
MWKIYMNNPDAKALISTELHGIWRAKAEKWAFEGLNVARTAIFR